MSAPPNKRPRGRPAIPTEVQRRRLLSAAYRAFEKQGYEQTRVADIVKEAGMSSRSFYEFFDSKNDLVAQVVEHYGRSFLCELRAILEKAEDPLEGLDRGLGAYFELFSVAPMDIENLGGAAGARVREARREFAREATDLVVGQLIRLHECGGIPRPPNPVSVELIITGIEGLSFRYYSEGRSAELFALRPFFVKQLVQALR